MSLNLRSWALADCKNSVSVDDEAIKAFNDLRVSRGKIKFVIYKITDDKKRIVVEESSSDPDWDHFLDKLGDAKNGAGKPAPRYATYDVEFEIPGEGKRYVWSRHPSLDGEAKLWH